MHNLWIRGAGRGYRRHVSALHGGGVNAGRAAWLRTIAVQHQLIAMFWRRRRRRDDHPADVAQAVMPDGCATMRIGGGIGSLGRPRFVVVDSAALSRGAEGCSVGPRTVFARRRANRSL